MSILVTGAAGFIGSHLVEHLVGAGEDVLGVDDLRPTYAPSAKRANLAGLAGAGGFELVECDIRDSASLRDAIAGRHLDAVVHLAALAGVRPSLAHATEYADVNVCGTASVLDAAVASGARSFVFASSSSVYGNTRTYPFRESDPVHTPISPYAATKLAGEMLCHTYAHIHGLAVTCLRYFTVFGPRQRPDLAIRKFLAAVFEERPIRVFGDGSTSRDYTFVSDIVAGTAAALHTSEGFRVINVGGGSTVTLSELIAAVERTVGKRANIERAPLQPGDMLRTHADVTLARTALGYRPSVSLDDGLRAQWEWMQAHPAP